MTRAAPVQGHSWCQHCRQQIALRALEGQGWTWVHITTGKAECTTTAVDGL